MNTEDNLMLYNCARLRRPYGKMGGLGEFGGSVWVMGEWSSESADTELSVMRFQKIFGLYGVEHHKVEKWSGQVGSWWAWWVCVGDGRVVSGSVDSGCHEWRCYRCGTYGQVKIELLNF